MVNSYHQKTFIILKSNDASKSNFTILQYKKNIGRGNHKYSTERVQENSSLDNCAPGQFPSRTIVSPDNAHLGQFYFILFFYTSNFLALIILQPDTVKLNVTKSYIFVDVVGVLALMQPTILCGRGGRKTDITDFLFYHEL